MSEIREDVLIRDFKKSDLDDFLEVVNESFAEEFEIIGFDPNRVREMVGKVFNVSGKIFFGFLKMIGKEPFRLFVAEADGRVVGTTMVNTTGKVSYITTVMVHPIYRRRGIATKLMKHAFNCIQKKKSSKAILHVVPKNTPAKKLYHKLGFKKFENTAHLIADINSLQKPQKVEGILIRNFGRRDTEAVYQLIKCSEDPTHLEMFDFKKKNLETPLIKRILRFSTDEKMVAIKNKKIVGYAEASYTTAKEAGYIKNIHVHPDMTLKGIEEMLIHAGAKHIKKVGTNKIIATILSKRLKLIEKIKQLGFTKTLEMETMVLEL